MTSHLWTTQHQQIYSELGPRLWKWKRSTWNQTVATSPALAHFVIQLLHKQLNSFRVVISHYTTYYGGAQEREKVRLWNNQEPRENLRLPALNISVALTNTLWISTTWCESCSLIWYEDGAFDIIQLRAHSSNWLSSPNSSWILFFLVVTGAFTSAEVFILQITWSVDDASLLVTNRNMLAHTVVCTSQPQ